MTCNEVLKFMKKPYPRTCADHGLTPCPLVSPVAIYGHAHEDVAIFVNKAIAPEFRGRQGVWILYGQGEGLEVGYIGASPIDVIMELTRSSGWPDKIAFWPHGMKLQEAVAWWQSEVEREKLAEWSE